MRRSDFNPRGQRKKLCDDRGLVLKNKVIKVINQGGTMLKKMMARTIWPSHLLTVFQKI